MVYQELRLGSWSPVGLKLKDWKKAAIATIIKFAQKYWNINTYITGGASGIGKGYALELAREGFSIYIVDKNKDDCVSTAREIERLGGVSCDFMVYDFGKLGSAEEAETFANSLK